VKRRIEGVVLDVDGVLSDGQLFYGPTGESLKAYFARDGLGLAWLREVGVRRAIVSGRDSSTVAQRARDLAIEPCLLARVDKAAALSEICELWALQPEQLAAVGDDLVDLPMLRRVGWSFAPADADSIVRACVHTVTHAPGGRGAVREVCEAILRARGEWDAIVARYGGEVSE
jgi:3-deoxy-D-manno-octulosonate 8-phosphate phosphatase (KDO 8-P phosphatase)